MDNDKFSGVRKEILTNLVVVDITGLPSEEEKEIKDLIKNLSPWTNVFRKMYEDMIYKITDDKDQNKKILVLQGKRVESEKEFRKRMKIRFSLMRMTLFFIRNYKI